MIARYTLPRMGAVWEPGSRYATWLRIELLACEAWAEQGIIPREALAEIRARAGFDPGRVDAIEAEVRHDVVAFLTAVAERVGPASRYIHLGLTSSDVLDTALALQLREASDILLEDLDRLQATLHQLALKHRSTLMIGRTHGVHAEPTTFGLKAAGWYAESGRQRERLLHAREAISTGKLSGAVGTFAHVPPAVEEYVCRGLGLRVEPVSTQIIPRDRHAEFLAVLGGLAASLERIATEIRHLQRTEVREVEEPFSEGQKGSSAMPHKRNPVSCEQICGLARVVRANVQAGFENVALWHERDISHSSVERVILPDSTILADYLLVRTAEVLEGLRVFPERMRQNLEATRGVIFSQQVLLALARRGASREEAYRLVQRHAMRAWEEGADFKALLLADPEVGRHLTPADIENCFDLGYHFRHLDTIYARIGLAPPPGVPDA
jgi:adenylosuccinate lyase